MEDYNFCKRPFYRVQIQQNGNVAICCPSLIKIKYFNLKTQFGNIFETPFEEIWNSPVAQEFRQSCIDKKYAFCRTDICKLKDEIYMPEFCSTDDLKAIAPLPKWVDLCSHLTDTL